MLYIPAEEIKTLFTINELIEIVENGILKLEKGVYEIPDRMHLENENVTYLLMPAMGDLFYCTKLVSVAPQNKRLHLPAITGIIALHDSETGMPVAILDAPMITALRTAAVGALGLKVISDTTIEKIGVLGCGVQGTWQTIFACTVRPVKHVYCFSRSEEKFINYKTEVLTYHPNMQISWCHTADEVVEKSEVIYACTDSDNPVFSNKETLVRGKRFLSIGSYKKSMQELPDCVYRISDLLIIDTEVAKKEVGDVINALQSGWISEHQIISLGSVLSAETEIEKDQCAVFKSVGMAAFDLALSEAIYLKKVKTEI